MRKVVNKFLLTGDKFMSEMHLKQPGFTYSACRPFTKHGKRFQKFRETGNLKHAYKNELGKACFAHDAGYSDSKYLANRTISNKILKERPYEIAINSKYDEYQGGLTSMVYTFFDKKAGSGASVNEALKESVCKV